MTKRTKKLIVNGLTFSRLIGALFLPIIFIRVDIISLILLLSILFLTDCFDGLLARRWEVQTIGGSLLDPLGDKMLAISCILALIGFHKKFIILIVSELIICVLNIYRTLRGEKVKSLFIGKVKTWFLSVTLGFGAVNLFYPSIFNVIISLLGIETSSLYVANSFVEVLIIVTSVIELFTIIAYIKDSIDNKDKRKDYKGKIQSFGVIFKRLFDENKFKEDKGKPLVEIIRK